MILNIDNIDINMFGSVSHTNGYWRKERSIEYHLIVFISKGAVDFEINEAVYHAEEGDVLFIAKDTKYRPLSSIGCSYYFYQFSCTEGNHVFETEYTRVNFSQRDYSIVFPKDYNKCLFIPTFSSGINFNITSILQNCNDYLGKMQDTLFLEALLRQLLILIHQSNYKKDLHMSLKARIEKYINDNILSDISLENISNHFCYNKSYISRFFKTHFNMTCSMYINKLRINNSIYLLKNTDMTISEISDSVGYKSVYYFSRVFKELTGVSPLEYKKSKRE